MPLTALLGVSGTIVEGGNEKSFAETVVQDITFHRQQQLATSEGLVVVVQKKRGGGLDAAERRQVSPLSAINAALFAASTAARDREAESIPFWQHLGLEIPEANDWLALTQELTSCQVPECADLVGHLALMHRLTRLRWAIARLSAKLSRNHGGLLDDYEARVQVLEELGFLEKDTRSGCLTRKGAANHSESLHFVFCFAFLFAFLSSLQTGRATCELQQMEVLLSEILFDGSIIQLPPADIAALLSCFVCESGMSSGTDASLLPPAQPSTSSQDNPLAPRVSLVSREEAEAAKPSTANLHPLPPTVPDHLQALVRSMFAKADQVRFFISVAHFLIKIGHFVVPSKKEVQRD